MIALLALQHDAQGVAGDKMKLHHGYGNGGWPLEVRWVTTLRRGASVCMCLASLAAFPAKSVDPREYQLVVTHELLSQVEHSDGRVGLELKLTLRNDGAHDLYDLRLFLEPSQYALLGKSCQPARIRLLSAGKSDSVTWTYECLVATVPEQSLAKVPLRVEAIDTQTHDIVSLPATSTEGG